MQGSLLKIWVTGYVLDNPEPVDLVKQSKQRLNEIVYCLSSWRGFVASKGLK